MFLKPPGWRPPELGGFDRPQEIDRSTYVKFDIRVRAAVNAYIVVQFIVLLATATFFLFSGHTLPVMAQWAVAGLMLWWVMDLGLLLEGNRLGLWAEFLRLAFGVVLLVTNGSAGGAHALVHAGVGMAAFCEGWLILLARQPLRTTIPLA